MENGLDFLPSAKLFFKRKSFTKLTILRKELLIFNMSYIIKKFISSLTIWTLFLKYKVYF